MSVRIIDDAASIAKAKRIVWKGDSKRVTMLSMDDPLIKEHGLEIYYRRDKLLLINDKQFVFFPELSYNSTLFAAFASGVFPLPPVELPQPYKVGRYAIMDKKTGELLSANGGSDDDLHGPVLVHSVDELSHLLETLGGMDDCQIVEIEVRTVKVIGPLTRKGIEDATKPK